MQIMPAMNREKAKLEPESQFASPADLLASPGLTRGEKITALTHWADLVERRLLASSEGMPTHGRAAGDAALLQELEILRLELLGPRRRR